MEKYEPSVNRAMALAGVVQAATLVKLLSWKGSLNQEDFTTCIESIFQTDPAQVEDVYGSCRNLNTGLKTLTELFSDNNGPKDQEIARYTISLLHLERLLIKKPEMLTVIQRGVERAKSQAHHFTTTHENVIANLAGVYTDTLSTFKFRIHVTGESNYLSNPATINKIRTLLLAGIRSAVLWRQLGGSRWQLVFGKKTLIQDAKYLLQQARIRQTSTTE